MPVRSSARVLVVAGVLAGAVPGVSSAQGVEDNPYYQFLIARHLESEDNASAALAALERAAKGDPDSAEIRAEMALLHYRANRPAQAEKAARAALALDADNTEANRVLGFLNYNAAQNENTPLPDRVRAIQDAISHFERIAARGTLDSNIRVLLGRLYLTSGQTDLAIEHFTEVVNDNPFSFEARRFLAAAFEQKKDYQSAIAVMQDVVDEDPRAAILIGDFQRKAGMYREAAESYTRAVAAQPKSAQLKEVLVLMLYESGQYDRAVTVAAEAQRQHPDSPLFPQLHAQSLFKAGDQTGAIELLEDALRDFSKDVSMRYTLAGLYENAGRRNDAKQMLRQNLEIDPSHSDSLNHLGYLFALDGENLDEAIRLVQRALEEEPNNGAYLDSLGWAYFKRGDLNEAEKYLALAATRLPDNPEVLDHLGDLNAARGRWEQAIEAWSRALGVTGDGIDPAVVKGKIEDARTRIAR